MLLNSWQVLAFALLFISWLVPNHYLPWPSFWNEVVASTAGAVIVLYGTRQVGRTINFAGFAVAAIAVSAMPLIQWGAGQIYFFGDAFIAAFYVFGVGLLVAVISGQRDSWPEQIVLLLGAAILCTSIISVGLAAYQWLGTAGLQLFASDAAPGTRPYANIGQPNHLATLLLLGLVSATMFFQRGNVGLTTLWLLASWLCVGVAMTQSRTAWLGMFVWIACIVAFRERAAIRITRKMAICIGAMFGLLVVSWPTIGRLLLIPAARSLNDQSDPGVRMELWKMLAGAAAKSPWFGYGWNQVSVAQSAVAGDYEGISTLTEHSHNLPLDLVLWCGIPVGGAIMIALVFWFIVRLRTCRNAYVLFALASVAVIFVHALLEYPMEYAYFLVPIAIWIGYVESQSLSGWTVAIPKRLVLLSAVVFTALLGRIVYEYAVIEEDNRTLRFEMAGYVGASARSDLGIVLLTQLQEFPLFAKSRATRDMTTAQLDRMRKMAERYGFPPILFRYALALALNGRQADASKVLVTLCKLHTAERCREGVDAWLDMANTSFPEIKSTRLPALASQ